MNTTATEPRQFHISDVLSVATGKLLSVRHMEGIYDLCNFMTGDDLLTHQLPRVSTECEPSLREQHPQLTAEPIPEIHTFEDLHAWLVTLYPTYGETVTVHPLPAGAYTRIDPFAELAAMRPNLPVVVVNAHSDDVTDHLEAVAGTVSNTAAAFDTLQDALANPVDQNSDDRA